MRMLSVKGAQPASILARVKGFLAHALKSFDRQLDLMNLLEGASCFLPLLGRHTCPTGIALDERKYQRGPRSHLRPHAAAFRRDGRDHRCNPLLPEIARDEIARLVKRTSFDFEQITVAVLAHHTIDPRVIIQTQGQKFKPGSGNAVLLLQTGYKVVFDNIRFFTHFFRTPPVPCSRRRRRGRRPSSRREWHRLWRLRSARAWYF